MQRKRHDFPSSLDFVHIYSDDDYTPHSIHIVYNPTSKPPFLTSAAEYACLPLLHSVSEIIQVIIPRVLPPRDHHPTAHIILTLILREAAQQILELILRDLAAQLAGPRQHDQPILYIGRPRLLHQPYPTQSVGGFGFQDLGENVGARIGLLLSGRRVSQGQFDWQIQTDFRSSSWPPPPDPPPP